MITRLLGRHLDIEYAILRRPFQVSGMPQHADSSQCGRSCGAGQRPDFHLGGIARPIQDDRVEIVAFGGETDILRAKLLAAFLGMTPENLSRSIKGLQDKGVSINGNRVTISDQSALEDFACPNSLIDDHAS